MTETTVGSASTPPDVEYVETDVVVIGAGAAGIVAALSAAEEGAQVILLEKAETPGGAGLLGTQGLLALESRHQKAAGETTTVDDGVRALMEYTHYRSSERLARVILGGSASVIDWLEARGMEFAFGENKQLAHIGKMRLYHTYVNKPAGYSALLNRFAEKDGLLLTGTTATHLVVEPDGSVSGVEALGSDGTLLRVQADSVIIATGGYAANPGMLAESLEIPPEDLYFMGSPHSTGDGYNLARQAGGARRDFGNMMLHNALCVPTEGHLSTAEAARLVGLPVLWVDQSGSRFVREDVVYDFALWGYATYAAGGHYYAILDSATIETLRTAGSPLADPFSQTPDPEDLVAAVATSEAAGSPDEGSKTFDPMPGLVASLQEAVEHHMAWQADDAASLAGAIGADPEALAESIRRYNDAVDAGADKEFFLPSDLLRYAIRKPPFYAVKARSAILATSGGISVDERLRVLDVQRRVIPGLYVTGNDAGGLYAGSYPQLEGLACCFAFTSGLLAGRDAAARAAARTTARA